MNSYFILLCVTLEQENAIQSLFKQQKWLYNRMKLTKTDNKDFASLWRRPDSFDNESHESMVESSSFNQNSQINNIISKYTKYILQRNSSEYKDQSDNVMNGSGFTNQSDKCEEARVDISDFHDRSHKQMSINPNKIQDKILEENQLTFEIIKEEGIDSCQPEPCADDILPSISSEQPQLDMAPIVFLNQTSIKVAKDFMNDSVSHVSNDREKFWRISRKQNNGDKGTSEIQVDGKTFKQQKNNSSSQVKQTGRKEKNFRKKIKGKASEYYLGDHKKGSKQICIEKSHNENNLLEIAEEQIDTGYKAMNNPEKIEPDSNKDYNMTLESSSGSKESIAEISEEKIVVDLKYNIKGHTVKESSKTGPTLAESDATAISIGKSKMEKGYIFCEECKERFKLAGKFRRHKRDGKCVFHCEFCGKRYISKDYGSFMVHRRYHMDDRPYQCHLCPKAYKFEYQLKVHFKSHAGEQPWVCEICGARFLSTFNLKQHKLNMHSEKTHICDICGASLHNKSYLEWHKKFIHSSERPFPCPTCGQHFKTKKTRKDHKLVHERALIFICDICSKGFKTKTRLNYHIRRHKDDRRYQCETCGKRFYCTKTLGNHQMIHSGEKPFKCSICDYRCTIKSNLGKHMKVHSSKSR